MERQFKPLTSQQVQDAIDGKLKLITVSGNVIHKIWRNGSEAYALTASVENIGDIHYTIKGEYCTSEKSHVFDLCVDCYKKEITQAPYKANQLVEISLDSSNYQNAVFIAMDGDLPIFRVKFSESEGYDYITTRNHRMKTSVTIDGQEVEFDNAAKHLEILIHQSKL